MSGSRTATDLCLTGFASTGTVLSTSMAMGCCAGLLAPVASVGASILPFLSPTLYMELLYLTVGFALIGLVLSHLRRRAVWSLLVGLAGAFCLLLPFHTVLELRWFYLLVGLGLGGLLFASWRPLVWRFFTHA